MSSARLQNRPLREITSTNVIGDLWRLIKLTGTTQPSLKNPEQAREREAFPTVLIAAGDPGMRQSLSHRFRQDPCNVLQADSATRLWHAIVNHSRPIHVLLLEVGLEGPDFADMAKRYRPGMRIFFVAKELEECRRGALPPGVAAVQARDLLMAQK